jgi:hypothetical protein
VRIYLPTTLARLAQAARSAGLDPRAADGVDPPAAEAGAVAIEVAEPGSIGFAVTPALREWYREGDIDELEYAAMTRAAAASLQLLADEIDADRRVVLAADVADAGLTPDGAHGDPAAVVLLGRVGLDQVVSAHVDDVAAGVDVRAAIAALAAAEAGDADAQFVVDGLDDHELQWYAVQEIWYLLP